MKFAGNHTTGHGRAKTLGFSTINLHKITTMAMENGVYAAWATIADRRYKAALFIGESPTFKDKEKSIEVHLIGLDEDETHTFFLDPKKETKISVETVEYLRPVLKFASREKLIVQIKKDVRNIEILLDKIESK